MKILIPAISQERIVTCLRTLRTNPKDIIVVDNSPNGLELPFSVGRRVHRGMNLGVAHSRNIGVRALMESDDTHLAICSQSVVFGRNGGRELKEMLGDEWGAEYVGLGWHLNMFTRKFFEAFGFFDENFHPAYMEDTDALYRMGLLDMPSPRENGRSRPYYTIDATCPDAGALKDGKATVDFAELETYYTLKWGGLQGQEKFERPFNNPELPINWWPRVTTAGAT